MTSSVANHDLNALSEVSVSVQLVDVAKSFGSTFILDGIELTLNAGTSLAICGPSGSGKSTLLSIIGLLALPSRGEVSLFGGRAPNNEAGRSQLRCNRMSWIFQSPTLLMNRTVLDNVTFALLLQGLRRDAAQASAIDTLKAVGLWHRAFVRALDLSGGEKQRLEVARAVSRANALILCDEPTASLDQRNSDSVMELLLGVKANFTSVIVVTHDTRIAGRCDDVRELKNGRLDLQ